jgi:hypothetical protein
VRPEEQRDLLVDVRDRLLALAVHVEDLQERLVYALVAREARLDLVDVADRLVELDRLLGLRRRRRRGGRGLVHLDLVPFGEEGVESQDELAVALEEVLDALDDALGVDPDEKRERRGKERERERRERRGKEREREEKRVLRG